MNKIIYFLAFICFSFGAFSQGKVTVSEAKLNPDGTSTLTIRDITGKTSTFSASAGENLTFKFLAEIKSNIKLINNPNQNEQVTATLNKDGSAHLNIADGSGKVIIINSEMNQLFHPDLLNLLNKVSKQVQTNSCTKTATRTIDNQVIISK